MKKILYLLLLISNVAISQIKLAQLEPCRSSTGALIDSCCVITGVNGFLKYLTIEQCQALYKTNIEIVDSVVLVNGIPLNDFCDAVKKCETKTSLVNNANGTYQYVNEVGAISVLGYNLTCVNDSTIQLRDNDGTVVTTCVLRGAATPPVPIAIDTLIVESDSTLTVGTTDGNQYTLDLCNLVKKCETNIIVLNNADGTYTIVNENGGITVLGYRLNCVNDSTIQIIDNDGTLVNQCIIRGGSNPIVPLAIDNITVLSDSTIQVHFTDGSTAPLDICNAVKKCETATNIIWNFNDNNYYYTNEDGKVDTISFTIGWNPVSSEIFHINHLGDTTAKISACDLVCPNAVSATNDSYSTNDCTTPFCSNVLSNDSPCSPGPTTSIALVGMATNGTATIDVNGNFCFTFLSCDPMDNYGFTYQITCPDGSTTTADVDIDLISTCPSNAAVEDFVLAFKNTATNFNVAVNDLSCTNKTYSLFTNPINGTIFFNPNGSGIYNPNSGYMGLDSCIVELHCNGQSCDTSWLKFLVLENAPADSTYYLFAGQTITGDASLNDEPCTPPSTTTFAWVNSLMPAYAGTLTGTPTAWTYVSSPSYCGDSYREYEQICTPPGAPGTKAKEMFKSVCASGVPDFVTILDDTIGTFNVSSNDLSCTNGAATTWHLFQDPSFSGTRTHGAANDTMWLYKCKGNCPTNGQSPNDKIGHIHSWDTLSGNMSYWIPSDYEGDLCFKYIMRCRLPSGEWKNDDTVCVAITREITSAMANIQIAIPDTTIPSLRINFTGFCGESPTQTALVSGDKIHVNIQTDCGQTVDVDLIVGQNIKLASGYMNDAGGKWASLIVPSITTAAPLMTNGGLLIGSFFFDLRKDTLAKLSNCWGDGTVSANKIGSQWRWNLHVSNALNCSPSAVAKDTIIKFYDAMQTQGGSMNIHPGTGGCTASSTGWQQESWLKPISAMYSVSTAFVPNWGYLVGSGYFDSTWATCGASPFISSTFCGQNWPFNRDYRVTSTCSRPFAGLTALKTRIKLSNLGALKNNTTMPYQYQDTEEHIDVSTSASQNPSYSELIIEFRTSITRPYFFGAMNHHTNSTLRPAGTSIAEVRAYIGINPNDLANVPGSRQLWQPTITSGIVQSHGLNAFQQWYYNPSLGRLFPSEGWYNFYCENILNTGVPWDFRNAGILIYSY